MELKWKKNVNSHYRLLFKDESEAESVEFLIEFDVKWKLGFKYSIISNPVPFPYDFKKTLLSIPIHIPRQSKRYFFKSCMDYVIEETDMPAHVSMVEHPGYPLMLVTFDPKVIDKETIRKILEEIMDAIEITKVNKTEKPKEEEKEEVDLLDEVDEDNVVEFEFDDELKEFGAKEPLVTIVMSLDEEQEDNDD